MVLLDDLLSHLSLTVKRDNLTKVILALVAHSANTSNPLNLFMKGGSSIGKTYTTVQATRYFPEKGVWYLGGLSPTALVHGYGQLEDYQNNPITESYGEDGKIRYWVNDEDVTKQIREIVGEAHYAIDLKGKILVFLESPHIETYNFLRPILSHDKKEITYKFTDKTSKGKLSTRTVVVRNWPATIFCTTDARWMAEMVSRSLTISPEESQEKYKEANSLTAGKFAFPESSDLELEEIQMRVRKTTQDSLYVAKGLIPFSYKLVEVLPSTEGADMRHFTQYLSLIQQSALLNMGSRPVLTFINPSNKLDRKQFVVATRDDFSLFDSIFRQYAASTRAGIPNRAIELFTKVLLPNKHPDGQPVALSAREISNKVMEVLNIKRSQKQLRDYELKHLEQADYVKKYKNPDNKREVLYEVASENDFLGLEKGDNGRASENIALLMSFSADEAKNWLNRLHDAMGIPCIFSIGIDGQAIDETTFLSMITITQNLSPSGKENS
ncbi:MAG: hypothetical protein HYU39_08510 [Thaumarchaeota archaeon]|nr:hypothetical protein [Nitrososphaerota archaeon]